LAKNKARKKLGRIFDYIEPYQQKWIIASECFILSKIILPEYTPYVMPTSKAVEGFAQNLIIDIGLVKKDHFESIKGNFSPLSDKNHGKRKELCKKEKYMDTMLNRLDNCLKINRHFMMHSDNSNITKVESYSVAKNKIRRIYDDMKEIFEYLNGVFDFFK
jgi:hypothetical protein